MYEVPRQRKKTIILSIMAIQRFYIYSSYKYMRYYVKKRCIAKYESEMGIISMRNTRSKQRTLRINETAEQRIEKTVNLLLNQLKSSGYDVTNKSGDGEFGGIAIWYGKDYRGDVNVFEVEMMGNRTWKIDFKQKTARKEVK